MTREPRYVPNRDSSVPLHPYCTTVKVAFFSQRSPGTNAYRHGTKSWCVCAVALLAATAAGPKGKQREGTEGPLHVVPPPTGEESALGCGVCRIAHTF